MKSRMVKRILATLLAVVFLAGDVLPTVASDVEGSTQVIKEAEEEASSLWEEVTPAEDENKENESETPTAPATTETPVTTEPTESVEKTEASTEEAELTDIEGGETPLADGLDEEAELKEGEEVVEEAEEEDYVILEHPAVDGVTVTVKAAAGVIPENTYVEVIELDDPVEVEEIISTITELENGETAENEEVVVKRYKAFDITLYVDDEDGNKTVVEPADREKVTVSFAGDMIVPEDGEDIAIYHVDDNNTSNVEKMEEVAVTTDENDAQVVELATDHFSKYVIVHTQDYYDSDDLDDWTFDFKVVDENGNGIEGCRFYLIESDDKYKYSTEINDAKEAELYTSGSDGLFSIDFDDVWNGDYYYVLLQVSGDGRHNTVNKIKIKETISDEHLWGNRYRDTNTLEVTIDDKDNHTYKNGDVVIIKNTTKEGANQEVNDPGLLSEVSKEATLVDWSNRVYKLDLNAVVNRTVENSISKVVVLADASGSMTGVDVRPLTLDTNKIYFSETCDSHSGSSSVYKGALNRFPSYRVLSKSGDYYNECVFPTKGYYYFYDKNEGAWYKREWKDLQSSKCYTVGQGATKVDDISEETLYTDRGDVLKESLNAFIEGLPEGTEIEFLIFNGSTSDLSKGFLTKGRDDNKIETALNKVVPKHSTSTHPDWALSYILKNYYRWYESNDNCNLVFFADGESDGNANSESWYSNLIRTTGVDTYSVGLKTTGGALSRVSDNVYLCDESDDLLNALKGISSDISLKTKGTVVDEISANFEICTPEGGTDAADIAAYYDSASIGENSITWNEAELVVGGRTTLNVYVKAKDDFAGGNVVPTNGTLTVSLNNVTKTATSPLVNVKGEVDANDQEDTIKRGETLEKYLEKHLAKVWNPEEQEPEEDEEGEEPKDPRFTTAIDSDYADVVIKFYEDEEHKKEITLENLKKASPEEDTTYYVVVEAVPKTTGANAQTQVGSAMTQDGTYYYMDRELENHQREAVAEAEYKIIVKGYELILSATKTATEKSWEDRTYTVNLEAKTEAKVTKTTTIPGDIKNPVRVVFLLDVSSSMRKVNNKEVAANQQPLTKLENQTKDFIRKLPVKSEVAAVAFDANAEFVIGSGSGFVTINSESERTSLANNLYLKRNGSGTRANEGLKKIVSLMSAPSYENTYLIFFTDGETYVSSTWDGEYAVDSNGNALTYSQKSRYNQDKSRENHDNQAIANAAALKSKGVKVYSVGMKNGSWTAAADNLLRNVATDAAHVLSGDSAASIANNFEHIYNQVSEESGVETKPVGVENITIYDEISEYFVLNNEAELRAQGAEIGVAENGLTYVKWTGLSTTEAQNTVTKSIELKAKATFAGGNTVPTNGEFKVTVPNEDDPENPYEVTKTTPYVDVNCTVLPGQATETIFLGEALAQYWVDGRDEAVAKAMINVGAYTDFSFLNQTEVEWYRDEACTDRVTDMLAEAPTKETTYYGKTGYTPISTGKLTAEATTVVGKYIVSIVDGKITVTKLIDNIQDAAKLSYDGQPIFTFELLDESGKVVQTKALTFLDYSSTQKSVTFNHLGAGKYTVRELEAKGWSKTDAQGYKDIEINSGKPEGRCSFTNKAVSQKNFADKDLVVNTVKKNEDGSISLNKVRTSDSNERHGE